MTGLEPDLGLEFEALLNPPGLRGPLQDGTCQKIDAACMKWLSAHPTWAADLPAPPHGIPKTGILAQAVAVRAESALMELLRRRAWPEPVLAEAAVAAASEGSMRIVTALMERGLDVNATDDRGLSMLFMTISWDRAVSHAALAHALLERGADPLQKTQAGQTPRLGLIRFRRHLTEGGYDGSDGERRNEEAQGAT